MVWPVAFTDEMKAEVKKVCRSKGLVRPHDPAIYVRRVVEENLKLHRIPQEVVFGSS